MGLMKAAVGAAAGVSRYKCDKCGWEPEKDVKSPKFCHECGDPFDDGDVV